MNKILNIVFGSILMLTLALGSFSCKDFLDEEMVSQISTSYFDTEEGVDALEVSSYQALRLFYGEEHGYTMTNYGTDEFEVGGGTDYRFMNDYSNITAVDPKPYFSGLTTWFNSLYGYINTANMLIEKSEKVLSQGKKQNTYIGTASFIRGYAYFRLLNQYGGVPLKLKSSEGVESEFVRASEADVFKQIIEDLEKAAELLPSVTTDGRVSKAAAWHFLAKVHLFRASERFSSITEEADLDLAVEYGLKVINKDEGTDRELADNYYDFWNYLEEGPNGPAEKNKEIILAAQYSNDSEKFDRLSNRMHLYFIPRYENNITGIDRVMEYGRPYQRLRPTDYAYDVFDRENDSRFWKSFRTLYVSTNDQVGIDPDGNEQTYEPGESPAIKIIINSENDYSRFTELHKNSTFPNYWLRYYDAGGEVGTSLATSQFAGLDKYLDPHRTTNANDINGVRDGYLARIGETYLIVAEAYGRKENYAKAVEYLNILRKRAGYEENENRNPNADGNNKYFVGGTYYESTGIAEGTISSTKSQMEIAEVDFEGVADAGIPYSIFGANTKAEKFLHFILNERSRELMGEFVRWEDLSRTKTLHARVIPFNKDNAAPQLEADKGVGKFLLRPIPQSFIDGVKVNGRALTAEEKQAMQNPGY